MADKLKNDPSLLICTYLCNLPSKGSITFFKPIGYIRVLRYHSHDCKRLWLLFCWEKPPLPAFTEQVVMLVRPMWHGMESLCWTTTASSWVPQFSKGSKGTNATSDPVQDMWKIIFSPSSFPLWSTPWTAASWMILKQRALLSYDQIYNKCDSVCCLNNNIFGHLLCNNW